MNKRRHVRSYDVRTRALFVAFAFVVFGAGLGGCAEAPDPGGVNLCCASDADPIFLKSKTDDDDGDGNTRDEDHPRIDDEDDDIADHAWVRDRNGLHHLFFQNEGHGGGSAIEHYTTVDLRALDHVGVALAGRPGTWDADGVWAPHIVENNGTYYMFYTGVEGRGPLSKQRIGVATSSDLLQWRRLAVNRCSGAVGEGCVYECNEPWTTWSDTGGLFDHQCRDPFVIWDADRQLWALFATAKSPNGFGVVTVANSWDLQSWTGAGYLDATRRLARGIGAQTTGGQCENPHVMSRLGTHYLLFTDWQDPEDSVTAENPRTITQYATSATLAADSAGSPNWTYRGSIPDPGVNAIEVLRVDGTWILSQSISNEASGDYEHRRELRLKCVSWRDGFGFSTVNFGAIADPPGCGPTGVRQTP